MLISSRLQTKKWRKVQPWYLNGKKNECEIYQRKTLEDILKLNIKKTNLRLNVVDNKLDDISRPLTITNGFNYTEDFDGIWKQNDKVFYLNMKMICDSGGSQTRTLREVYHFIICQYKYLLKYKNDNINFVNIIDGDCGYKFVYDNLEKKYASLKDIQLFETFDSVNNHVYIGDTYNFLEWYNRIIC